MRWDSLDLLPPLASLKELLQMTMPNKLLDLVSKLCTFFSIMAMVMIIKVVLIGIALLWSCSYLSHHG